MAPEVTSFPEPNPATCNQFEATIILLDWQAKQRAFDAQLATIDAIMSEPQVAT